MRRTGLAGLRQAFDEARFGANRTLNLRESLPTAAAAAQRAEVWLRGKQAEGVDEALVITGRGNNSPDGVSVVRERVISLLHSLKRRGIVAGHIEHTPGSFVVEIAPLSAAVDAPRRRREKTAPPPPPDPITLDALDAETRQLLRDLAVRALEGLGIKHTDEFLTGEMLKQFGVIARNVPDGPDRERRLRAAVRVALDQHE